MGPVTMHCSAVVSGSAHVAAGRGRHSRRFRNAWLVGSSSVPGPVESGSRYVALRRVMRATVEFQFGLSAMAVTMSARVQLSGWEQCNETVSC